MWKAETRRTYDRTGLRYPTDMTDPEWGGPRLFVDVAQRGPRRQRRVDLREVLNAVFYVLGTGCQWRALPKDLPPRSTVHDDFVRWQCDGALCRLHHALYEQAHERAGKEASPTTAIVDSQSVKGAERGDAGPIRWATMRPHRSPPDRSGVPPFGPLHALAVHDGGRRAGLLAGPLVGLLVEGVMQATERAVALPTNKVVMHRAARGQVFGQGAPLAPSAEDVEH